MSAIHGNQKENFVSATDKSQDVPFEKITVSGQVDTSKAGVVNRIQLRGKEETAYVTVNQTNLS